MCVHGYVRMCVSVCGGCIYYFASRYPQARNGTVSAVMSGVSTPLASLLLLAEESIKFITGAGKPATAVAKPGMADGGAVVLEQFPHATALRDEFLFPGKPVELELGAVQPRPIATAGLALEAKPDGRLQTGVAGDVSEEGNGCHRTKTVFEKYTTEMELYKLDDGEVAMLW